MEPFEVKAEDKVKTAIEISALVTASALTRDRLPVTISSLDFDLNLELIFCAFRFFIPPSGAP